MSSTVPYLAKADLCLRFVPGLPDAPHVPTLPKVQLLSPMLTAGLRRLRGVPASCILNARANAKGQVELQVAWVGYDETTWELEEHVAKHLKHVYYAFCIMTDPAFHQ